MTFADEDASTGARDYSIGNRLSLGNGSGIRPAWLEVNLGALARNTRAARRIAGNGVRVCGIVKADGYGHGATYIAPTLLANGADCLAVATIDEGLELRDSGIAAPILVLGPTDPDLWRLFAAIERKLSLTAHTLDGAKAISAAATMRAGMMAAVHIKFDSGMGRIGLPLHDETSMKESVSEACAMYALKGVAIEGAYTHFAVAGEEGPERCGCTKRQLELFLAAADMLKSIGARPPLLHCANSAALACLPESYLDMVRPGIMLYGSTSQATAAIDSPLSRAVPSADATRPVSASSDATRPAGLSADAAQSQNTAATRSTYAVEPTMSLYARVAQVKTIPVGAGVSYGLGFVAARPTRVATLPLGYADGIRRLLSCGKGCALVNGRRAPIIGAVCMDMAMLDVTDAGRVEPGDVAVLLGRSGENSISLDDMAASLGTISYEVLCLLNSKRLPRVYVDS